MSQLAIDVFSTGVVVIFHSRLKCHMNQNPSLLSEHLPHQIKWLFFCALLHVLMN